MKLYKLTNEVGYTMGGTRWGEGITHELPARGAYKLCSADVLHAYISPALAVLMDTAHGWYLPKGQLWECEGDVVVNDGTKVGCIKITTLHRIDVPAVTLKQRQEFAVRCVMHVSQNAKWRTSAERWLDGSASEIPTALDHGAAEIYASLAVGASTVGFAAVHAAEAVSYVAMACSADADFIAAIANPIVGEH